MRARFAAFVAILSVLFCFGAASGDEAGDLRSELQRRKDHDYPAPLDRAHRRELRGVVRALALLDRPAANPGARATRLAAMTKDLARTLPSEFAESTSNLRVLIDAVVAGERARVDADYEKLAAAVPAVLDERLHDRAERRRTAARAQLELAVATPFDSLRRTARAAGLVAKGLSAVARDPRDERFAGGIDGVYYPYVEIPYAADDVRVAITELPGEFQIDALGTRSKPGDFFSIRWTSSIYDPVTGPGVFDGWATMSFGSDPDTITDFFTDFTSIEIVELDPASNTFRARFDWALARDGRNGGVASTGVRGTIVSTKAVVH